jgi:hypothetical protein
MNLSDMDSFFVAGAVLCAIMAVVSALRHKKRGLSAYIMAVGFLVLGSNMLMLRMRAPEPLIVLGCVVLVLLLIGDFAVRAANTVHKDDVR